MITGFPCSGKTTLAKRIAEGLEKEPFFCTVTLIRDTAFGFDSATTPQGRMNFSLVHAVLYYFLCRCETRKNGSWEYDNVWRTKFVKINRFDR